MRNRQTPRISRAFTLIEILIVVVILGILAAIVIPQFTDASDDAMQSSVRSQLQTIRSQIELWNVQNPGDMYDDATVIDLTFWDRLVDNNMLQTEPRNPLQNNSTAVVGAAADGSGWVWREQSLTNPQFELYAIAADGTEFVE